MKKNIYILKIFILILSIAPFSSELYSSYSGKRLPAGKRPVNYSGPRPLRHTPMVLPTSAESIAQNEKTSTIEQDKQVVQPQDKELPQIEPSEDQKQLISDIKSSQKDIPQLGWFARAYSTVVPYILLAMDKAIGKGTAESTENLIKNFLTRKKFLTLKNDLLAKTDKIIKPEFKNISEEEKLEIGKKQFLTKKEAFSFEKNQKETSIPSIFAQAINIFVINTAVNIIATFFGYGTKIGLNALMPDQK